MGTARCEGKGDVDKRRGSPELYTLAQQRDKGSRRDVDENQRDINPSDDSKSRHYYSV